MSGKRNWVDLTGDDENIAPQRKRVNHVGSSSQPSASQSLNSSSQGSRDAWGVNEEENDIIDLSQDVDEGNGWLCVGAIDAKIVGVRYYSGYATMNEQVMVKREPGNPYDSNAIRINNVHGTQIGHIARNLAAKLAPYMVILTLPLSSLVLQVQYLTLV
jgi:SWI/SNF-related matrix-associated actin-dependent regulator of chromatin subfamily A3